MSSEYKEYKDKQIELEQINVKENISLDDSQKDSREHILSEGMAEFDENRERLNSISKIGRVVKHSEEIHQAISSLSNDVKNYSSIQQCSLFDELSDDIKKDVISFEKLQNEMLVPSETFQTPDIPEPTSANLLVMSALFANIAADGVKSIANSYKDYLDDKD